MSLPPIQPIVASRRPEGSTMNLQTFKASTMAEALAQVKSQMGTSAVILHTRTYHRHRWLGLRRQEIVEITAGQGLRVQERTPRRQAVVAGGPSIGGRIGAYQAAPSAPVARSLPEAGRQLLESPAGQSAAMM